MSKRLMQFCIIVALIIGSILLSACSNDEAVNAPSNTANANATNTANPANASNQKAGGGSNSTSKSTYYGAIDFRDCEAVKGWVWNSADPKADIKVSLYIDDKMVETIPAKTMRPDLKTQNIGTGEYGFSFKIPASYKDGQSHTVSVKTASGDYTLPAVQGLFATAACKP
ncbi:MAG: hypothetical protein WCB68_10815 [Pyrinomonadaceae bacterium]